MTDRPTGWIKSGRGGAPSPENVGLLPGNAKF